MDNPYLDEAKDHLGTRIWELTGDMASVEKWANERMSNDVLREELVKKYSWAIPTEEAIKLIARFSPIVDIGAGTGYWPWLLQQVGADVIAYDISPGFNDQAEHEPYTRVRKGGPEKAAEHSDRALMLVWPPRATSFGSDCARAYSGDYIIYVGESNGCTGSQELEEHLGQHFIEVSHIGLPQWDQCNDYVRIYKRPEGTDD